MATLPQQPTLDQKRSLQININSEDDAKAVIQHLPQIKKTFDLLKDTNGVESIEFVIAESIRKKVEATVTGAINWCRTYTRLMAPFAGNAHFPLPHYVAPPVTMPQIRRIVSAPPAPGPVPEPLGKSKRLVPADAKGV